MKKISYIKNISMFLGLAAVVSLSSCLKDKNFVDFAAVGTTVELPLSASGIQSKAFNIDPAPTLFQVAVNVASPKPLSTDLVTTLKIDAAALTAYNTANDTEFELLPTDSYTITSLNVTIPAGQRLGYLNVNISTTKLDPSITYALPITLADASGQTINANYHTLITTFAVKNKYDGRYTVSGTMVDVTNATLTGNYPRTVDLVTQNGTDNAFFDVGIGNFTHAILSAGSLSQYGSFGPVFTFDASNKVTKVINIYGQPAGNTRSAKVDPTGINAFTGTPGTAGSVLKVKYIMNQTNSVGDRVFFDETFTYVGPRP